MPFTLAFLTTQWRLTATVALALLTAKWLLVIAWLGRQLDRLDLSLERFN